MLIFCILFKASISEKHETRQIFIKHYCVTLIKKKLSIRADIYVKCANKLFITCESKTSNKLSQWRKRKNTHCWCHFLSLVHFDNTSSYSMQNKDKYNCERKKLAVWGPERLMDASECVGFPKKSGLIAQGHVPPLLLHLLPSLSLLYRTRTGAWDKDNITIHQTKHKSDVTK